VKTLVVLLALAPLVAHAQSFFELEAGVGVAKTRDMGDGVWVQKGLDNSESLTNIGFMGGLTGSLYERGNWSIRYHADYVYMGRQEASTDAVPDANYNPVRHQVLQRQSTYSYFNGQGHTQGIALTLQPTYAWRGVEFGLEAGYWAYWATWHQTAETGGVTESLNHQTKVQFAPVVGASIEYKNVSVSYRYYKMRPLWSPVPGIATGVQMVTLTYRF